jgi:SAM-dependent methyltransferase
VFWEKHPASVSETDFLTQVSKTVGGKPIDSEQIDLIVKAIIDQLPIVSTERVVDLCCGNGYLTRRVAAYSRSILGIDFSAPLITVAERFNRPENVSYLLRSVLDLPEDLLAYIVGCGKAYMYEALQHFSVEECRKFLASLGAASAKGFVLLICSIPDRAHLFDFYDTRERRQEYERRLAVGNEAVGTWWKTSELVSLAEETGFACEILPQDGRLYTAHYRFNARLMWRGRRIC